MNIHERDFLNVSITPSLDSRRTTTAVASVQFAHFFGAAAPRRLGGLTSATGGASVCEHAHVWRGAIAVERKNRSDPLRDLHDIFSKFYLLKIHP